MSFENKAGFDQENNNPFDLPVIKDKKYHQSDNENVD